MVIEDFAQIALDKFQLALHHYEHSVARIALPREDHAPLRLLLLDLIAKKEESMDVFLARVCKVGYLPQELNVSLQFQRFVPHKQLVKAVSTNDREVAICQCEDGPRSGFTTHQGDFSERGPVIEDQERDHVVHLRLFLGDSLHLELDLADLLLLVLDLDQDLMRLDGLIPQIVQLLEHICHLLRLLLELVLEHLLLGVLDEELALAGEAHVEGTA